MEDSNLSISKKLEWEKRAKLKNAIVPQFFEVFPNKVEIVCGKCGTSFKRSLIINLNEPTFVCPNENCKAKNWIPLKYDLK